MAEKWLTSADAILTLVVTTLYPTPVLLQGWGTDDAWTAEAVTMAETQMGIDGKLSAGYVPNPVPFELTLQADSESMIVMDTLGNYQRASRELLRCDMVLTIPATAQVFSFFRGVHDIGKPAPDGRKILQPRKFNFKFESVIGGGL